jgi:hypothetical protein
MKSMLSTLSLGLLLYSCIGEAKIAPILPSQDSIWGTWVFGSKIENTISFEDSICRYGSINLDFGVHKVSNDTISIYRSKESFVNQKPFIKLKVLQFCMDSILVAITSKNKAHFIKINALDSSVFYLKKIKEKEPSIPPTIISFCSSSRPNLKIEIDSQRNVLFMGFSNTALLNGYKGKLTKTQFKFLHSYIKNLPLNKLKDEYAIDFPGLQGRCLYLKYRNGEQKICSYGIDQEPKELKILYHKLAEMYKHIDLKQASLTNQNFVFKQIGCGIPPPPPPFPKNLH